jgi:hypothetical protein
MITDIADCREYVLDSTLHAARVHGECRWDLSPGAGDQKVLKWNGESHKEVSLREGVQELRSQTPEMKGRFRIPYSCP